MIDLFCTDAHHALNSGAPGWDNGVLAQGDGPSAILCPGCGSMNQAQSAAAAAVGTSALTTAQAGIDTLFANQSALSTQLQADISSVTTTGWDSLTAADRDAIMLRILNGFGTSMQAQMDHITVTGHNPNVS